MLLTLLLALWPAAAQGAELSIPELIDCLQGPKDAQRRLAVWRLGRRGVKAAAAVPALAGVLDRGPLETRLEAALALGQLGPRGVSVLAKRLGRSGRDDAWLASIGLRQAGARALPALSALNDLLASKGSGLERARFYAIQTVQTFGKAGASCHPRLMALLRDHSASVAEAAARALGGFKVVAAIPGLARLYRDVPKARWTVAWCLIQFWDPSSFRNLVELADDRDRERSEAARWGVTEWLDGTEAVKVAIAVSLALTRRQRRIVGFAIGRKSLKSNGIKAIGMALCLATDVRRRALGLVALGKSRQHPKTALTLLGAALSEKSAELRSSALISLAELAQQESFRKRVVPLAGRFAELLGDADTRVRADAARALSKLKEAALPQLDALIERLRDANAGVRYRCTNAIEDIGCGAITAVPALEALLEDPSLQVRKGVVKALKSIREGARKQTLPERRRAREEMRAERRAFKKARQRLRSRD